MLFPIIASLAQAFGVMTDKVVLSKIKVPINRFIPLLFSLLAFFTLLVLPFDNWLSTEIITWPIIGLFGLMILLAFSWNILYYQAIQRETVQEFEPILMLSPLVVVLLAPIFYAEERSLVIFLVSLVAGIILVLSNLKKGQIRFQRESLGLVACIFLMGLEVLVIRRLLDFFAPATLYFIRCTILFLLFLVFYRTSFARVHPSAVWGIVMTSLLGVAQMVARFYSYQSIGILFTTLVLSISPALVYLFGFFFLKEKILPKRLIGGILIFVCVIIGYLLA